MITTIIVMTPHTGVGMWSLGRGRIPEAEQSPVIAYRRPITQSLGGGRFYLGAGALGSNHHHRSTKIIGLTYQASQAAKYWRIIP